MEYDYIYYDEGIDIDDEPFWRKIKIRFQLWKIKRLIKKQGGIFLSYSARSGLIKYRKDI